MEVVVECSDVWVSEHSTVQVLGLPTVSRDEALVIEAAVIWQDALRKGAGLGSGPRPGASVLDEQILDTLNCRVIGQVAPTRPRHALCAHGVGPQRTAVPTIHLIPTDSACYSSAASQIQCRSHKVRVASQNPTRSSN